MLRGGVRYDSLSVSRRLREFVCCRHSAAAAIALTPENLYGCFPSTNVGLLHLPPTPGLWRSSGVPVPQTAKVPTQLRANASFSNAVPHTRVDDYAWLRDDYRNITAVLSHLQVGLPRTARTACCCSPFAAGSGMCNSRVPWACAEDPHPQAAGSAGRDLFFRHDTKATCAAASRRRCAVPPAGEAPPWLAGIVMVMGIATMLRPSAGGTSPLCPLCLPGCRPRCVTPRCCVQEENAYAEAVMAPSKPLQQRLKEEMLARIPREEASVPQVGRAPRRRVRVAYGPRLQRRPSRTGSSMRPAKRMPWTDVAARECVHRSCRLSALGSAAAARVRVLPAIAARSAPTSCPLISAGRLLTAAAPGEALVLQRAFQGHAVPSPLPAAAGRPGGNAQRARRHGCAAARGGAA